MNYRHAFHAGNFADVVKHSLLLMLLEALNRKPAPWCYIDTHAGAGAYDLSSEAARRTGEAVAGIGRLWQAQPAAPPALAGLLGIVAELNPGLSPADPPHWYPGSPAVAAALARPGDRLVLGELQAEEAALLKSWFRHDGRVAVHARDGYEMLKALTPPKEKRGLVLLDPPYENPQEFTTLAETLVAVHARWPGGCYAAWYPLKDDPACRGFLRKLEHSGLRKLLLTELRLSEQADVLAGSGMLIVNPPWQTEGPIRECLQALARLFTPAGGKVDVHWLVPE